MFHDIERYDAHKSVTNVRNTKESLFILETANGMDLSLYLDESTIVELTENNPFNNLNQNNLNAFCLVAEGVSHFVYLIWSATHNRTISQLELELQAEVDKYILCASVLAAQSNGVLPANLCELLFDKISFSPDLTLEQKQRYESANNYAKQYCNNLHSRMMKFGESKLITKEIRHFYRLWHQYKIKRIDAIPATH